MHQPAGPPTEAAPPDDVQARVAELQRVLMENHDPGERAHAHLELGRIALRAGRFEQAVRHLREALHHDHRLDAARRLLGELGEASALVRAGPKGGRRQAVHNLLRGFRRG